MQSVDKVGLQVRHASRLLWQRHDAQGDCGAVSKVNKIASQYEKAAEWGGGGRGVVDSGQ